MNWKFNHDAERLYDAVGLSDINGEELLHEAVTARHSVRGCVVVATATVILVDEIVKDNLLCTLIGIVLSRAIKKPKLSELVELFAQELYKDRELFKLVQRVLRKALEEEESDE